MPTTVPVLLFPAVGGCGILCRRLVEDLGIFGIRHHNPDLLAGLDGQIRRLDSALVGVDNYGVNPAGNLNVIPVAVLAQCFTGPGGKGVGAVRC